MSLPARTVLRIEPAPFTDAEPFVEPLPGGDDAVIRTLEAMRELVAHELPNPLVQSLAAQVGRPGRTYANAIALFKLMRERVRFNRDPARLEWLQRPSRLAAEIMVRGQAVGDCDDRAMLAASLALALGMRPAFVVIGTRADGPYEHVYYALWMGEVARWQPFDPQEVAEPFREAPHERKLVYPL